MDLIRVNINKRRRFNSLCLKVNFNKSCSFLLLYKRVSAITVRPFYFLKIGRAVK